MFDILTKPELLSALLSNMPDGLSVIDPRGTQIYVNDALCQMLGFTRAELLGRQPPYISWPVEERANVELEFERKDGRRIEMMVAPSELRDETGTLVAYFATVKDVSEHKQLQRALAVSEQRWKSIAENPFDFVVLIDRDYRYTYVNHTAPGISPESLIGKATPFDFVAAQYHDTMRAAFETTFQTGRATSYEVSVPQLESWYSSIVGAVIEQGRVSAVSILTREITAHKRAEEALKSSEQRIRESRKMEAIGTLAGGIAHDVNNMLTPILAYTDLARNELPPDSAVHEYVEGITIASQRVRQLVQRILLFSRKQELTKTVFDLRQSVQEDVTLLKATIPASIELAVVLPDKPVHVCADRLQLGQALTNLATNAIQVYGAEGGRVTIALEVGSDEHAVLSVTDSGSGMDEETARRAFEPFFTTKPFGLGTGLGLSIVDGVVREHGGEMGLRSAPGEGTVITVRLPMTSNNAEPSSASAQPQGSPRARCLTVLVVDDDPSVLNVACRVLTKAGHVVIAATSGQGALEIFTRSPDTFDVILTDQSMPGMTGTSLIAEVRALRPLQTCLLMTGRGDDALSRRASELGVEILAKPFSVGGLLDAFERTNATNTRTTHLE